MKKIFSFIASLSKRPLRALIVGSVVALPAAVAIAGYLPADRKTFTMQNPATYVAFNSITNNPNYGDERPFHDVKDAAVTTAGGFKDSMEVKDGQEILLRAYVHNNGADNLNGANLDGPTVAKNTRVSFRLPTATEKNLRSIAYVYADNASPQVVEDSADFYAAYPFSLQYVTGSAVAYNNAVPAGMKLDDSIVSNTGALIGYQTANGVVPGCLQYANIVTIKVRIKMEVPKTTKFTVDKQVRKVGETTWKKVMDINAGDDLEYKIGFDNTGDARINNVAIRDVFPSDKLAYVAGSARLVNSNVPNGTPITDDILKSGVIIGDYSPGINAYVTFRAKAKAVDSYPCGKTRIENYGAAQPRDSAQTEQSLAVVNVNRTCVTQFSYSCSALDATSVAIKLGDTVTYTAKVGQLSNTSVTGYVFKVNGVVRQDSTSAVFNYTPATVGTYTVDVQIRVNTPEGVKLTEASQCQKQLKVTEKPKVENPEYNCTAGPAVSFVDNSRNIVRLTMADSSVVARGGAVVKSFVFDYGDGTVPFTTTGKVSEDHRYNDGTYTARVTVNFDVAGQTKSVTNNACTAVVTVKPETPPTTPPVTVTEIPKTGAGDAVAAFFGTSVSAYAVRTWTNSRKALKSALKR